jgi:hypothetical protein
LPTFAWRSGPRFPALYLPLFVYYPTQLAFHGFECVVDGLVQRLV